MPFADREDATRVGFPETELVGPGEGLFPAAVACRVVEEDEILLDHPCASREVQVANFPDVVVVRRVGTRGVDRLQPRAVEGDLNANGMDPSAGGRDDRNADGDGQTQHHRVEGQGHETVIESELLEPITVNPFIPRHLSNLLDLCDTYGFLHYFLLVAAHLKLRHCAGT